MSTVSAGPGTGVGAGAGDDDCDDVDVDGWYGGDECDGVAGCDASANALAVDRADQASDPPPAVSRGDTFDCTFASSDLRLMLDLRGVV
ncbi:MAG: hypothetical protein O7C59_07540, partial [Rickettsia endosymbiont of Ixodes persulcatus]|nr:hypothetical protein [Rickettsia endosymbiont of Ixodes persulcatus]